MLKKVSDNIYFVGALHAERKFFDEVIPLPDGTSYNSYIVKGKNKTALIDAVEPVVKGQLYMNLKKLGIDNIDYIISNHAEQDHSGEIPGILERFPGSKVVTNKKNTNMLKEHLLIPEEKIITIKEGDTLDLGGKTLEFFDIPWVHWPETMAVYAREDKVLFPCDFFGSHTATTDIFNQQHFYIPAKRYYAEIMSPFRNIVRKNIEKVEKYDIDTIAPSHGIIYKKPQAIIDAYKEWSSDAVKNEAVIAYISMHSSVKKMAGYLSEALAGRNINVKYYNLAVTDTGELAMSLVDAATLVVGAATMLAGMQPIGASAVYLANALRPKTKFVSLISSYGWGEKASSEFEKLTGNFKAELLEPVLAKGYPKKKDFESLDRLANDIEAKHKEAGIL